MHDEIQRLLLERRSDPTSQPEHTQVRVDSPKGPVKVDAGMVVILQHLWAKGVNTFMSCEDDFGSVWIHMDMIDYDTLMHKARASADLLCFLQRCLCKIHTTFPEDFDGLEIPEDEDFVPPTKPEREVAIRFPARHKQLFERLLATWEVPEGTWPRKRARVTHAQ
jgi:hypothetical protein